MINAEAIRCRVCGGAAYRVKSGILMHTSPRTSEVCKGSTRGAKPEDACRRR